MTSACWWRTCALRMTCSHPCSKPWGRPLPPLFATRRMMAAPYCVPLRLKWRCWRRFAPRHTTCQRQHGTTEASVGECVAAARLSLGPLSRALKQEPDCGVPARAVQGNSRCCRLHALLGAACREVGSTELQAASTARGAAAIAAGRAAPDARHLRAGRQRMYAGRGRRPRGCAAGRRLSAFTAVHAQSPGSHPNPAAPACDSRHCSWQRPCKQHRV